MGVYRMSEKQIERTLLSVQRSMEVEGFEIDSALKEQGRKVLAGEADADAYIAGYIQNHIAAANE